MFASIRSIRFAYLALFVVALAIPSFSKGTDVDFHGTVTKVDLSSTTAMFVDLRVAGTDVRVRVTTDTEVEAHGDETEPSDIRVGDFVKVSGFFMNSGITAREITILDRGDGEFRLLGQIGSVRTAANGTIISVLGIDVLIDSETKLARRGSNAAITAAGLAANMFVDARGIHRQNQFLARLVIVGQREEDPIRVHFEGKITALATGRLTVDTQAGGSAVVLIDSATVVTGT